jgi:hypothetical protein
MAQHRRGLEEEARKTLDQARRSRGTVSPHVWHEAEVLIEGKMDELKK